MFKHRTTLLFVFIITAFVSFTNSFSQDKPAFVDEFVGQLDFVEGRLLQLEGAMPQDKMSWTPAEGVRNCAEVYLHVADANNMLANFVSGKKTEGENSDFEKTTINKEEIAKALKESFAAIRDAIKNMSNEDLNKVVKTPFGLEMSTRNFMISLLNHMHEHLGQGIAYARMNGVVPPWSKKKDSEG